MAAPNPRQECPLCGESSQTQPVPAIVAGHTSYSTSHTSSLGVAWGSELTPFAAQHTTHGVSRTPLASMLDLPRPLPPRTPGVAITVLAGSLAIILIAAVICLNQSPADLLFVLMCGFLSLMWPIAISAVIVGIYWRKRCRWTADLSRWETALSRWEDLRYCHRDHVVFDAEGMMMRPELAASYCYEQP